MELHTYLTFDGDCREAFRFYEECLGGRIEAMMTFGDTPACDGVTAAERDRVMHAHLSVAGHVLMGCDSTAQHPYAGVQGAHLVINLTDRAEAERIFNALSEGGQVEMPLEKTFWAERFGMTVDRFGVPWMINCGEPGCLEED